MNGAQREERVQRIRIGLTGLAVVFLLVVFGTAISRSSGDSVPTAEENELMANQLPNEPLAEIGAAPGTAAGDNEASEKGAALAKKP